MTDIRNSETTDAASEPTAPNGKPASEADDLNEINLDALDGRLRELRDLVKGGASYEAVWAAAKALLMTYEADGWGPPGLFRPWPDEARDEARHIRWENVRTRGKTKGQHKHPDVGGATKEPECTRLDLQTVGAAPESSQEHRGRNANLAGSVSGAGGGEGQQAERPPTQPNEIGHLPNELTTF